MAMDKNLFKRADLHQISSFILFQEQAITQAESYEERLEKAKKITSDILEEVTLGKMSVSEAQIELVDAFDIYQEVYMEIGMKVGSRILVQLLFKDDNPDSKNTFK